MSEIKLSAAQIREAREWLCECGLGISDFCVTASEPVMLATLDKAYTGGREAFARDTAALA